MPSNEDAVREYLQRGFSLVPFKAIRPEAGKTKWGKRPIVKWEDRARTRPDPETVLSEFRNNPDALIGCITGPISGIVNLDVDDDEGRARADELISDSLMVPTYRTISGGLQMIFEAPTPCPSGAVRFLPGLDFRGTGSVAILPPHRLGYSWMPGLSLADVAPPRMPNALSSAITNKSTLYRGGVDNGSDNCEFFTPGRRNEDIFSAGLALVKQKLPEKFIRQSIRMIAQKCNPPLPSHEVETILQSAFERGNRRERNLAADVREWVLSTSGNFLSTEVAKCQQLSTRGELQNLSMILKRLCDEGIIEKYGNKNGCFRRVETEVEPVNFLDAPTDEFPIQFPLDVHDHCLLFPSNIIVVAGGKDAGKTAFLLNTVRMNQDQHEIVYLNSEMGDTEFRNRLEMFPDIRLHDWKFKPFHRASNFADLITPERKIFIVDFLELTTDFWKVAGKIQEIHTKLREGICIIALQKADGKDIGRGGDFSREKARLYLSLSHDTDRGVNTMKIVNAKAWRTDRNPRGMHRDFKLIQGWRFVPQNFWRD